MFELIVKAMGGTVEEPEVQELLRALGSTPDKPTKPNKDGYVVAKKHGVELLFDANVTSDRFPRRKIDRKQARYLCYCWIREEKYRGSWPEGYRPDLTLTEMRERYGEDYRLWGGEWDEVRELRWRVPLPSSRGAEFHPTFRLLAGHPTLSVALESHLGYFEYLDTERADPRAGFFVAWCALRGLLDPGLAKRASAAVQEVKARRMTGRELVVAAIDHRAWDGKHNHVWSCDLSPEHLEFFHCYLNGVHTEELWGEYETSYRDDFQKLFGKRFRALKDMRWDAVPDTWEHYDEIAEVISGRFEAWAPKSKQRRRRIAE